MTERATDAAPGDALRPASDENAGRGAPRAPEAPFEAPWQAQAFALVVSLHARGAFTWPEWAAALSRQIAAASPGDAAAPLRDPAASGAYWLCWLAALEALAQDKGLVAPRALAERRDAWAAAARATPHGQPVELPARSGPAAQA